MHRYASILVIIITQFQALIFYRRRACVYSNGSSFCADILTENCIILCRSIQMEWSSLLVRQISAIPVNRVCANPTMQPLIHCWKMNKRKIPQGARPRYILTYRVAHRSLGLFKAERLRRCVMLTTKGYATQPWVEMAPDTVRFRGISSKHYENWRFVLLAIIRKQTRAQRYLQAIALSNI